MFEGSLVYPVTSRPVRASQQDPFSNNTYSFSFLMFPFSLPHPYRAGMAAQVKRCTPGSSQGFLGGDGVEGAELQRLPGIELARQSGSWESLLSLLESLTGTEAPGLVRVWF